MARMPTPGGDNGSWGEILNDFLSQAHTNTGALKSDSVDTSHVRDGAITRAKTSSGVQTSLDAADSAIPSSQKGAADGVATLDGSSKLAAAQIPAVVATKSTNSADTGKAIDAYTGAPLVVVSGGVLENDGVTRATGKKLVVTLTADGTDIEDLTIEDVA